MPVSCSKNGNSVVARGVVVTCFGVVGFGCAVDVFGGVFVEVLTGFFVVVRTVVVVLLVVDLVVVDLVVVDLAVVVIRVVGFVAWVVVEGFFVVARVVFIVEVVVARVVGA